MAISVVPVEYRSQRDLHRKATRLGWVVAVVSLVAGWLGVAFVGISRQAEWSVTAPLWAYFLLLLIAIPHEWWQTQRRSRRLLATFSHYVAQPVLDEILRLGLTHSLTPTLREVTVLIADMEDYTHTTSPSAG